MYDKNENRGEIMKKTETEYLYSDNNVLVFKDNLTQEVIFQFELPFFDM